MNRIFRLVFNRALGQVQVVSELACRARNGVDARPARLPLPAGLAIALLFAGGGAWAQTLPEGQLPTGESVRHGSASFDRGTTNLLKIMQNGRTVIDWTAFDIGTGAKVDFVQSAGSIALNRVTGGSVSQ
ncbi:MAG: ESPR-type extended signal peptide-containing protein, partial [Luteimonas sp.]